MDTQPTRQDGPTQRALTIRQPWADLIMSGAKDVENRTWSTSYRGRLWIHAAVKVDTSDTSGRLLATSARTEPVPGDLVSQAPAVDFAPVEATIDGIIRDNALPGVCPVQDKP